MHLNTLKNLGMSDNEAKVYLMLLRLGASPATSLSKRLNIKRVTTYSVLSALEKRGLVVHQTAGKHRLYAALNPEKIMDELHADREMLNAKIRVAENNVSELKKLFNRNKAPIKIHKEYFSEEAKKHLSSDLDRTKKLYIYGKKKPSKFITELLLEWPKHLLNSQGSGSGEAYLFIQEERTFFYVDGERPILTFDQDPQMANLVRQMFESTLTLKMG